jgi:hypothetical protein
VAVRQLAPQATNEKDVGSCPESLLMQRGFSALSQAHYPQYCIVANQARWVKLVNVSFALMKSQKHN